MKFFIYIHKIQTIFYKYKSFRKLFKYFFKINNSLNKKEPTLLKFNMFDFLVRNIISKL